MKPLKRHPYFIPFSQEHHHTLSLCAKILRQPNANYQKEITLYYKILESHFQAEEALFAPLWQALTQPEWRQRFETEHATLRQLYREADFDSPQWNITFATQLRDHARFEKRELFEQFQAALWRKEETEMKNGIPHLVPLSRQVIALLEQMKPFTGHYEYVFYNKSTGKPLSDNAANKAMHRLGYQGIATPHGFRHTASTNLNEMDYNRDWIEYQLAHKEKNSSRDSYNFAKYLDSRAKMLQEWADYLDGLKQQAA